MKHSENILSIVCLYNHGTFAPWLKDRMRTSRNNNRF